LWLGSGADLPVYVAAAQGFQLGGPNEVRDLTRLMGATSLSKS
jgi:hypothetical protein